MMKFKIKLLVLSYLAFLVFSLLSGLFEGIIGEVLFALGFVAPLILVLMYLYKTEDDFSLKEYLGFSRDGGALLIALGAPTVAAVAGLSYITSSLIYAVSGVTENINVGDSYAYALISFALIPAVLEEGLFRYLPMKMLCKASPRVCVLLSAVMFAAAHRSFFQLGYAFLAGVIFMIIDIGSGSVLPSLILHFLNNVISLTVIFYGSNSAVITLLNVIICLLLVLSFAVFAVKRKFVIGKIKSAFKGGEKMGVDITPLLFIIPALTFALGEFM